MPETNIIEFTDAAIQHIKTVIAQTKNGVAFRLSIKQTGCSGYMYVPDVVSEPKPGDQELQIKNITIYLDPKCISLIQGTVIDYVTKELGMQQLVFNNPNAESLCGCGESFNLKDDAS